METEPPATSNTTKKPGKESALAKKGTGPTEKAGFAVRLLAYLLDLLICLAIILIPIWLVVRGKPNLGELIPATGLLLYCVIFIVPVLEFFLNKVLLTVKFGGGIGKLVCGLAVTDEDGKLLRFRQAIFRYVVGYFVSGMLFGLGFLWILRDPQRQGWHDHVSGTFVVVKHKKQSIPGGALFFVLVMINVMLGVKAVQSIKENSVLQNDAQQIMEIIKESLLENGKAPATIEPQEAPTII